MAVDLAIRLRVAVAAAQRAYEAALAATVAPRQTINAAWYDFVARQRATSDPDAKLAIAERATAVLSAFSVITPQHRALLAEAEQTFTYPAEAAAAQAAAKVAWSAHPVLAEYRAERLAAEAARSAYLQAMDEARRQQAERDAPARLLAALKSRGLRFALSADGKDITLPPAEAATLAPGDLAAIKQHKAGIIAVLAAEAEAARPVVVA